MNLKKIGSIVLGFGTIGLLSSAFAKLQGYVYPNSLELFNDSVSPSSDSVQYIVKLFCVYVSCFIGGIVTNRLEGGRRELFIVGGGIMVAIGWLWVNVREPLWFWLFLALGVLPFVFLGSLSYKIRK